MRIQLAKEWYKEVYETIFSSIKDPNEAEAFTKQLLSYYMNYTTMDHVLERSLVADDATEVMLSKAVERICAHEPIQYVLGYVDFCGERLLVNEHVLIPRPETEEMVNSIIDHNTLKRPRILDLGTGSGCIAIALAKKYREAVVCGLDNSVEAIEVARKNIHNSGVKVNCYHIDLLKEQLPHGLWDIIVSNPPYIRAREREEMHVRVLNYEPWKALFVQDDNPLVFYQRIALLSAGSLADHGCVYVEVNEVLAEGVVELFLEKDFRSAKIWQDFYGKPRWVVAKNCTRHSAQKAGIKK